MTEQQMIDAYGMSSAELVAWFDSKKENHPSIGYFPKSQVWYTEIVLGKLNDGGPVTHMRVVGNGPTLVESIGNCRNRMMEVQSKNPSLQSE